ncbi:hypothetical protein AVEN_437-1 [Araneus ventricosus]|uniref:Uncharacterized protein n=1 Tax=Araneus ventricosus TaxID=182803 RepID=A0A4Y2IZD0_ARAVE|nr:hypothetical protein AVEN_437-1 [Araneus ventricosus]
MGMSIPLSPISRHLNAYTQRGDLGTPDNRPKTGNRDIDTSLAYFSTPQCIYPKRRPGHTGQQTEDWQPGHRYLSCLFLDT